MRHIQARASDEEYKLIRKKAIDLGLDLETFIIQAALEKVNKEEDRDAKKGGKRAEMRKR